MSDPKYRPWMSDELTEETKVSLQKDFKIHDFALSNKPITARDHAINTLVKIYSYVARLFRKPSPGNWISVTPWRPMGYSVKEQSTGGDYHRLVIKTVNYRNETRKRAIKVAQGVK